MIDPIEMELKELLHAKLTPIGCTNMVDQVVPTKYDYKVIEMKCGSTGIDGQGLYCEDCRAKNHGRPWYICRHGNDVSEYMCGRCEGDSYS